MKAIILAAGCGTRLHPITLDRPKCLLEVRGRSLLHHQLDLLAACGVEEITVVIGYQGEKIRNAFGDRLGYWEYPGYAFTNNLYTLHHARHLLAGDTLVLFSDVLVTQARLEACVRSPADFALLVDTDHNYPGTMRVRRRGDHVVDIGGHIPPSEGDGNFIGIAKFSAAGAARLRGELEAMAATGGHRGDYYTAALPRLAAAGTPISVVPMAGAPWIEIDDLETYEAACQMDFWLAYARVRPQ